MEARLRLGSGDQRKVDTVADILSLKRARKAKKLAERQITAAENSTRYGLTKAHKQAEKAAKALADKKLDGHKRKD